MAQMMKVTEADGTERILRIVPVRESRRVRRAKFTHDPQNAKNACPNDFRTGVKAV